MDRAAAVMEAGQAALQGGEVIVDFSLLTAADSSALAVLFAWQREQKKHGGTLRVYGAPKSVRALAALYGVHDLLIWDNQ